MGAEDWQSFQNEPLGDDRTWSAAYDSYDQHYDQIYFLVTVNGPAGTAPTIFMVGLDITWSSSDDWNGPEFIDGLRRNLARVAATGQTNTTHTR